MTTGTIKYSQEGSLTGGGTVNTTGTAAGTPVAPKQSTPASSGPNFSSVSGAQQQVAPNGQVLNSTPAPNMSVPAPNFSSINGQEVYTPPPTPRTLAPHPAVMQGTYEPASTAQALWATPPGEFISGIKESINNPQNTGQTMMTGSPANSAGALAGVLGQIYGTANMLEGAGALAETQVTTLSKVGTLGRAGKISSTAGNIATNGATAEATISWLTKVAQGASNPRYIAGEIMAAIGTYPFAGFAKYEALKTLSFASNEAMSKGNVEDAQRAIDRQKEILHPKVISGILQKIPFANVLNNLKDLFTSFELRTNIDQHIVNNMIAATSAPNASYPPGTGPSTTAGSSSDFWTKSAADRQAAIDQQHAADEEYYKQVNARRAEAEAASRAEDEAYWKKIADDRAAATEAKRKEEEAYWSAYYTRVNALSAPKKEGAASYSKLNFGLLK